MAINGPQVSIGMPVYNEEQYIEKALDSLLSQTFENFEIVIADNASTDRTGEICQDYMGKDQRIVYHRLESNIGSIANFNRAFKLSHAKYFFWASGHDLRHETFISSCLEVMEREQSVVLSYPLAKWQESGGRLKEIIYAHVDTRGLDLLSGFNTVLWGLQYAYPIYGLIRSSELKKTGLLGNTIGGDIVLLAELSLLGKLAQVPEPLLYMRKLPDYGSWGQYLVKAFGSAAAAQTPVSLYISWIRKFIRIIAGHESNLPKRIILVTSVIFCLLTKYRGVLKGLRSGS